ncbi:MAG: hypothetical protein H7Y08_01780 [Rhizobiaceae bacterium]|nr:hypothetical protein [Rhizobiaceae bacterium]
MLKLCACALSLLATCAVAQADCDDAPGPAENAVRRLVAPLAQHELDVCVFYGDYSGDGAEDAVVFFYFADPNGGNSFDLEVTKLRQSDGRFRPDGLVEDVYGESPRDARFFEGRIEITMTTPQGDDPRCCPTGTTRYTIDAR